MSEGREQFYTHDLSQTIIPSVLANLKRWIHVKGKKDPKTGKRSKIPCTADGRPIDAHDSKHHGAYSYDRPGLDLKAEDRVVCIDVDDVPYKIGNRVLSELERERYMGLQDLIVEYFENATATEPSISNIADGKCNRVHIYLLGRIERAVSCKKLGIEIYNDKRFILTTGQFYSEDVSSKEQETLDRLIDRIHAINEDETTEIQQQHQNFEGIGTTQDYRDAWHIVKWFFTSKIDLCPDNDSFVRIGHALKSCRLTIQEVHRIMVREKGYTSDAWKRICSFKPKTRQIASLVDYAKKHGYEPPKRELKKSYEGFDKVEVVVGKFTNKDAPRPQLTSKLSACGDSVAVSGRAAGGKTTHVFHWIRRVQALDKISILINSDLWDWQIKEKVDEHNLNEESLVRINLRGKRHLHIDQLVEAIREAAKDREIGIICIDNTLTTGLRLWKSINTERETRRDRWKMTSDDCAIKFHEKVIDRLSQTFNCVVVFIGHPGKNSASKDKFPGSEQWTAYAGVAYRIYRINDTNIDETPKSIIKKFTKNNKEAKKWTLASVFKPRYPIKDYFLAMTGDGAVTVDVVDDAVDLTQNNTGGKNKLPDPEPIADKIKEHLRKNKGEKFGFNKLMQAIGERELDYTYWCGIVILKFEYFGGYLSSEEGVIYWDYYYKKPVVWCHKIEKAEK